MAATRVSRRGWANRCRVGTALGPGTALFLREFADLVDFVEIAYEQLLHDADHALICDQRSMVLHCSALSLGGTTPIRRNEIRHVGAVASALRSPWIGEHLAFSRAAPASGPGTHGRTEQKIGFTVCPQLSSENLKRVARRVARAQQDLPVPLIVENPPIYFDVPGSSIPLASFVTALCEETGCGLILDVAHLLATARNSEVDSFDLLRQFPLDRVVEVHMSGCSKQMGIWWDDHAVAAEECAFEILREIVRHKRPLAVTFEYNWSAAFSTDVLAQHLEAGHRICA